MYSTNKTCHRSHPYTKSHSKNICKRRVVCLLQKAAVAYSSVHHPPKSLFISETWIHLRKATVEPHIKALCGVLNPHPKMSISYF